MRWGEHTRNAVVTQQHGPSHVASLLDGCILEAEMGLDIAAGTSVRNAHVAAWMRTFAEVVATLATRSRRTQGGSAMNTNSATQKKTLSVYIDIWVRTWQPAAVFCAAGCVPRSRPVCAVGSIEHEPPRCRRHLPSITVALKAANEVAAHSGLGLFWVGPVMADRGRKAFPMASAVVHEVRLLAPTRSCPVTTKRTCTHTLD
jgi:hypothetical protein